MPTSCLILLAATHSDVPSVQLNKGASYYCLATSSESTEDPKVKAAFFVVESSQQQLVELAKLIESGVLRSIVSEVLPIDAAAQAYLPMKKTNPGKTVLRLI